MHCYLVLPAPPCGRISLLDCSGAAVAGTADTACSGAELGRFLSIFVYLLRPFAENGGAVAGSSAEMISGSSVTGAGCPLELKKNI